MNGKRSQIQLFKFQTNIIIMILLIIATLLFLALIIINFIKVPSKLLILCACVSLLLVVNFMNQIQAGNQPFISGADIPKDHQKQSIKVLKEDKGEGWKEKKVQTVWNQLIQDEKYYVNMIVRSWEERENSLYYFQGLHRDRLDLLIDMLLFKVQNENRLSDLKLFNIDFEKEKCNKYCLQTTFKGKNKDKYYMLIVENIQEWQDIQNIEELYFDKDVTIIFQSPKKAFRYNSIFRFVDHHVFSNNYVSKFIGHYSSQLIQKCLNHKNFDYFLYRASKQTPLQELCQREVYPSQASKCIRKLVGKSNDPIPENWVRFCLNQEGASEIEERNGWIYPQKESSSANGTWQKDDL